MNDDLRDEARTLLIVDDDERFADTLATEFRDRNYEVACVCDLAQLHEVDPSAFQYAIVDLRLRRDSGLDAIDHISSTSPGTRIVVLTGYGSIATAVQATKLGAVDYLTKPIDFDEVERALLADPDAEFDREVPIPPEFQSLHRHEREYIEFVLAKCGGNISQAARRLGLHRQSLQRKLRKYTPN